VESEPGGGSKFFFTLPLDPLALGIAGGDQAGEVRERAA
jgi:hypothetical protein